ncbi:MAG: hypothetical protein D8B56_08385 [Alloprevotella sp.]|nr:MAG: hypothetical protein D8B56_08385 [Alloprevotella sp.]
MYFQDRDAAAKLPFFHRPKELLAPFFIRCGSFSAHIPAIANGAQFSSLPDGTFVSSRRDIRFFAKRHSFLPEGTIVM